MKYNIQQLKCCDVAKVLADKCFTAEQKAILEYLQGEVEIKVEDQLMRFYNFQYLIYSLEDTIKMCAQIVHDNAHEIDTLSTLKERIKIIRDPGAYKQSTKNTASSVGCTATKNDTDSTSKGVVISDSTYENTDVNFTRTLSAEPTKLIKNSDNFNDNSKLTTTPSVRGKFVFKTGGSLLEVEKQNVAITHAPVVEDNRRYHNLGFTHTGDLSYGDNNTSSEDRRSNVSKTVNKGSSSRNDKGITEVDIQGESAYKSLHVIIPRVRDRFWHKFGCLFTHCLPC